MSSELSTSREIIEQLCKDKIVEKLVSKYTSLEKPYIRDLVQDIYIELLNKSEYLIVHLYVNDEFEYYIRKMIKNQLFSKTSKFYYNYVRPQCESLDDNVFVNK